MRVGPPLFRWLLAVLLLATAALVGPGCKTPDSENESARPWNAPKHWEHGLPSGMWERR